MDPSASLSEWGPHSIVAAGVCARVAAAVATGTLPILPGASLRIRIALAAALAVVAVPGAWATAELAAPVAATAPAVGEMLAGELLVGLALGTAVAAVLAAAGWAGGILGSVSGLSWADDFDPDAAGQGESAGIARLARWVALAAFFAAGGQLAVVAGIVDSVRHVPVGTAFGGPARDWIDSVAIAAPGAALELAVHIAMPALAAVVTFHLAAAICLRTIPFTPGQGLLQSLAAVVLLAAVWLAAESWAGGTTAALIGAVDGCFPGR